MSPELVAALVGAVAGGILAVLGGLAQVFIQGWISERGEITCDVAAKLLTFRFRDPTQPGNRSFYSLKDARAFSNEKAASAGWQIAEIRYAFTANFLNTKGTNAAALEYSVRFLKGKRTVATSDPTAASSDGALLAGQAVALPAENATGIEMQGG